LLRAINDHKNYSSRYGLNRTQLYFIEGQGQAEDNSRKRAENSEQKITKLKSHFLQKVKVGFINFIA